jgi:hypothetical protein
MIARMLRAFAACMVMLLSPAAALATSTLGFEIGTTTLTDVRHALTGRVALISLGSNFYTHGPMFKVPGKAFDLDGLNEVLFIFRDGRLDGVVMHMDKSRFDAVIKYLRDKYELQSSEAPVVGNKEVVFHDGTTTIELNSPHLSFEMEVRYMSDRLVSEIKADWAKTAAEKAAKEAVQF